MRMIRILPVVLASAMFSPAAALAQAAPAAPASAPVPAAVQKAPVATRKISELSEKCLKEAIAKHLHGSARSKFRAECVKKG